MGIAQLTAPQSFFDQPEGVSPYACVVQYLLIDFGVILADLGSSFPALPLQFSAFQISGDLASPKSDVCHLNLVRSSCSALLNSVHMVLQKVPSSAKLERLRPTHLICFFFSVLYCLLSNVQKKHWFFHFFKFSSVFCFNGKKTSQVPITLLRHRIPMSQAQILICG